jgi:predicted ATPase/class 3 adenylate cyclase/Tfp pilus assembly protein PilF
MPERPTGTVSLLFTDIEGSTTLLRRLGDGYGDVLARQRAVLRRAIDERDGREVDTQGDAVFAVFPTARDAVAAAARAQQDLAAEVWPDGVAVRVRMGVHTGEPATTDEGYVGMDVHIGARVAAAAHGGQILISEVTRNLLSENPPPGCTVRDLGEHRLKDISAALRLYQVDVNGLPADFPPPRTLTVRMSNLPALLAPLIGRDRELAEVTALLREEAARLVTLTGPGGTGKTRLSLAVASALLNDCRDGVCFVPLDAVTDAALVPTTIAQALNVRDGGGLPIEERLRDELRDREILLVLDNFEQVVSAAPTVAGLLAACPRLTAVVTSRELLHLSQEREYHLGPLPTADAVSLFEQRARAARPGFAVTPANEAAVVDICRRLDGLPLALELAAARIKLLSPDAVNTRLQRRLHLLVGGARDRPSRQQTLRAAIDWSHDLLAPAEQRLFARLAVFAGGCTLESAEAVCDPDGDLGIDVLKGVTSLVDKSLMLAEEGEDSPRVGMLQTIHEYAAERLQVSGEGEVVAARHAEHVLALAEEAEPELWGADQEHWFRRLDLEHDNMRRALGWAVAEPDPELATRLVAALGAYWEGRGQVAEAYRWFEAALGAGPASASSRGRALLALSRFALMIEDDAARARPLLEEALTLLTEAGDTRRVVVALSHLALTLRPLGDDQGADAMFVRSVELARREGDDWALALALNNQGSDLIDRGVDPDRARSLSEEALTLRRRLGERRGLSVTLASLGSLALTQGDPEEAIRRYEESLELARRIGHVPQTAGALAALVLAAAYRGDIEGAAALLPQALELARELREPDVTGMCLTGAAALAVAGGDLMEAGRLCGAAERLHEAMGWTPAETRLLANRLLAAARERSGAEGLELGLTEGRHMSVDEAVAVALAVADPEGAARSSPSDLRSAG